MLKLLLLLSFVVAIAAIPMTTPMIPVDWVSLDDMAGWAPSHEALQLTDGDFVAHFAYNCDANLAFVRVSSLTKNVESGEVENLFEGEKFNVDSDWFKLRGGNMEVMFHYHTGDVKVEVYDDYQGHHEGTTFPQIVCVETVKGHIWRDCDEDEFKDKAEQHFEHDVFVYLCETNQEKIIDTPVNVAATNGFYQFHYNRPINQEDTDMLFITVHSFGDGDWERACLLQRDTAFGSDYETVPAGALTLSFHPKGVVEKNVGFKLKPSAWTWEVNGEPYECEGEVIFATIQVEEVDGQCFVPEVEKPSVGYNTGCTIHQAFPDPDSSWPSHFIPQDQEFTVISVTFTTENADACDVKYQLQMTPCVPEMQCPNIGDCCANDGLTTRKIIFTPPTVWHQALEAEFSADGPVIVPTVEVLDGSYLFPYSKTPYKVTWSKTYGYGETSSCDHYFNVTDCEDPVCDPEKVIFTTNEFDLTTSISWTYDAGFAKDNNQSMEDGVQWWFDNLPAQDWNKDGDTVGLLDFGTHVLNFMLTDTFGNVGECSRTIFVEDKTPPTCDDFPLYIQCVDPENCKEVVHDENTVQAFCTLTSTVAVTVEPPTTLPDGVQASSDARGDFKIGTNEIKWELMDEHGQTAQCTQYLLVEDCAPPECDIDGCDEFCAVGAEGKREQEIVFVVNAKDNAKLLPLPAAEFVPAAENGYFGFGEHTVRYLLEDEEGNKFNCSMKFEVKDCTNPKCWHPLGGGDVHEFGVNVDTTETPTKWYSDLGAPNTHDAETAEGELEVVGQLLFFEDDEFKVQGVYADGMHLGVGLYKVVWTVTDAEDNSGTCEASFLVKDMHQPDCENVEETYCPEDGGYVDVNLTTLIVGEYSDNLDESPEATGVNGVVLTEFQRIYVGQEETFHYQVEDDDHNTRICKIEVKVNDCMPPMCNQGEIDQMFWVHVGPTFGTVAGVPSFCDDGDEQNPVKELSWGYMESYFHDYGEIDTVWSEVVHEDGTTVEIFGEPATHSFRKGNNTIYFHANDTAGYPVGEPCPVMLHIADCTGASCDGTTIGTQCNDPGEDYKAFLHDDFRPDADGYDSATFVYESNYFAECNSANTNLPCWNATHYLVPISKRDDPRTTIEWNVTDADGNLGTGSCETYVKVMDCEKPECTLGAYHFCIEEDKSSDMFGLDVPQCTDNRPDSVKLALDITLDGALVHSVSAKPQNEWDDPYMTLLNFTDEGDNKFYTFTWTAGDLAYEGDLYLQTVMKDQLGEDQLNDDIRVRDCAEPTCEIYVSPYTCAVLPYSDPWNELTHDVSFLHRTTDVSTVDDFSDVNFGEGGEAEVRFTCTDANAKVEDNEFEIQKQHQYCPKRCEDCATSDWGAWEDWTPSKLRLGCHMFRVRALDKESYVYISPYNTPMIIKNMVWKSSDPIEVSDCDPPDCEDLPALDTFCATKGDPKPHLWHIGEATWTAPVCTDASDSPEHPLTYSWKVYTDAQHEVDFGSSESGDFEIYGDLTYGQTTPPIQQTYTVSLSVNDYLNPEKTTTSTSGENLEKTFTIDDCQPPLVWFSVDGGCANILGTQDDVDDLMSISRIVSWEIPIRADGFVDNPNSNLHYEDVTPIKTIADPVVWDLINDELSSLVSESEFPFGNYSVKYTIQDHFDNPSTGVTAKDWFSVDDCEEPKCDPTCNDPCDECSEYYYEDGSFHEKDALHVNDVLYGKLGVPFAQTVMMCQDLNQLVYTRTLERKDHDGVWRLMHLDDYPDDHSAGSYKELPDGPPIPIDDLARPPGGALTLYLYIGEYRLNTSVAAGDHPARQVLHDDNEVCDYFIIGDCVPPTCDKFYEDKTLTIANLETTITVEKEWWDGWTYNDNYLPLTSLTRKWTVYTDELMTDELDSFETADEASQYEFVMGNYFVKFEVTDESMEDNGAGDLVDAGEDKTTVCKSKIIIKQNPGEICGFVWHDFNQNGKFEDDKEGHIDEAGVDIVLTLYVNGPGFNDAKFLQNYTLMTSDEGQYCFEDVPTNPDYTHHVTINSEHLGQYHSYHLTTVNEATAAVGGAYGSLVSTERVMGDVWQVHTGDSPLYPLRSGEERGRFDFGLDKCTLKCDAEDSVMKCVDLSLQDCAEECLICNTTNCPAATEGAIIVGSGSVKEVVRQLIRKRDV